MRLVRQGEVSLGPFYCACRPRLRPGVYLHQFLGSREPGERRSRSRSRREGGDGETARAHRPGRATWRREHSGRRVPFGFPMLQARFSHSWASRTPEPYYTYPALHAQHRRKPAPRHHSSSRCCVASIIAANYVGLGESTNVVCTVLRTLPAHCTAAAALCLSSTTTTAPYCHKLGNYRAKATWDTVLHARRLL